MLAGLLSLIRALGPPPIAVLISHDAAHSFLLKSSLHSTSLQVYLLGQLIFS